MKEKRFNGEIGMTLQDSRLSFAENSMGKKLNVVYIVRKFVYMFVFKTALKDGISTSVDLDIDLPFEYSGKINEIEFRAAPQVVTSKEMLDEFFRLD